MADMPPAAPASMVFVATTAMRESEPASVDPALKPNHPKQRTKVPKSAIGRLWPKIGLAEPSALYFPRRGPSMAQVTIAMTPPVRCTTPEPAKSTYPLPSPALAPSADNHPPPHPQFAKIG